MKFNENNENTIRLPNAPSVFVYFLVDGEEVVYVGQTKNGITRPLSHADKEFNDVYLLPCTAEELDELEDFYINKYLPPYNRSRNKNAVHSLLWVRDKLRMWTHNQEITKTSVKHYLRDLGVKPQMDQYTGNAIITHKDFLAICELIGVEPKPW